MKAWLAQHRKAFGNALRRLVSAPLNTLLGALVVGIALALPGGGEMLLTNVLSVAHHFSTTPQISLFAALDASKKDIGDIEARLRQHGGIKEVRFVSREEALQRMKDEAGLADIIDSLPRNPLPDAFVVTPRDDRLAQLEQMRTDFAKLPKVEHVQLDAAWVKRLDALLRFGRTALLLVAGMLGVALVAVTFNTIRLQILTQREEIEVSRLLGATDSFIRRPFYYFGALQGLLGGLFAWLIVWGAVQFLRQPLGELASLYSLDFSLRALPPLQSMLLLAFAALLGWMGASLSVGQHLRDRAVS